MVAYAARAWGTMKNWFPAIASSTASATTAGGMPAAASAFAMSRVADASSDVRHDESDGGALPRGIADLRLDESRAEHRHADRASAPDEVVVQRLAQADDRELRRAVHAKPADATESGERRRVDDVALVLIDQQRQEGVHTVHDPEEIDAEHPFPELEWRVDDAAAPDARVVAHHVHRADTPPVRGRAGHRPRPAPTTSVGTPNAVAPETSSAATVAASVDSSTSASTRRIPAAANRSAIARPIPLAPPVTTATRSRNSCMSAPIDQLPRAVAPACPIGARSTSELAPFTTSGICSRSVTRIIVCAS